MPYEFRVNGEAVAVDADGLRPLAVVLREDLGLPGTKVGCFEGRCGACTVIVDGRSVVSCLFPVALAAGAEVRTVEGLAAADGTLNPLQDSILDSGGVQCGISTPGVLMTLTALLERTPHPTEEEIRAALAGNVCRCTGYQKIVDAVLSLTAEVPA
jgi:aerobic-type carbon monoxide dehydrogenase small subunit (CoxS/CutS family)